MLLLYICLFIIGLFLGSFLNLVADRSVSGESIIFGRSHCDYCKHSLRARDLLPLVSFMWRGGKCAYCKTSLSYYYPISELLSGFVVMLSWKLSFGKLYGVGSSAELSMIFFWYYLIILSSFVVLSLTDLKHMLLPDNITLPVLGFVAVFKLGWFSLNHYLYFVGLRNDPVGKYLITSNYFKTGFQRDLTALAYDFGLALAIGVFFWLLTLIKNGEAMGGGDVKLAMLIGLVNGFPTAILAIFLAFLFGSVGSILLIAFRGKTVKDTVVFGPFLILGSVVALVWGAQLLSWYLLR